MRKVREEELKGVLKLDGRGRYAHFIRRVVDEEVAWGLWNDGWALMADNDGRQTFPLWPACEYAQRCASGDWAEYVPREIGLEHLLETVLPALEEEGVRPAVFPTPEGKGVVVTGAQLGEGLREEMRKYP